MIIGLCFSDICCKKLEAFDNYFAFVKTKLWPKLVLIMQPFAFILVCIIALEFANGISLTTARIIVHRRSRSRSRRGPTYTQERNKKCDYVNTLFVAANKSCSVPPLHTYANIYEKSYKTQLWEFQQKECNPEANVFLAGLFIMFMFCYILMCIVRPSA